MLVFLIAIARCMRFVDFCHAFFSFQITYFLAPNTNLPKNLIDLLNLGALKALVGIVTKKVQDPRATKINITRPIAAGGTHRVQTTITVVAESCCGQFKR